MKSETSRYNIVVRLSANIGLQAALPEAAKAGIEWLLRREPVARIGKAEFVIEDARVTGVFDKDWNEIENLS